MNGSSSGADAPTPNTVIGRLVGDVKIHFDDAIGPATAWIGRNGTGKTSRQEGISLALAGHRLVGKELDGLAPTTGEPIHAALTIRGTTYVYPRTKGVPAPPAIRIVRPATWLQGLGPARAREEVVKRWGGPEAEALLAAPATITPAQQVVWREGLVAVGREIEEARAKHAKKSGDPADIPSDPSSMIARLESWAHRSKNAVNEQVKALATAIEAARVSLPTTAGAEDLGRLEGQLERAEKWERSAVIRERASQLTQDAEAYVKAMAEFGAAPSPPDRSFHIQCIAKIDEVITADQAALVDAQLFVQKINASPGYCPCCGVAYDPDDARSRHAGPSSESEARLSEYKRLRVEWRTSLTALEAEATEWEKTRASLSAWYERLTRDNQSTSRMLEGLPTQYDGPPSADLRPLVQGARTAAASRRALEGQAEQLETLRARHAMYRTIETAAKITAGELVRHVSTRMNDAIRAALPAQYRDRFAFDLARCQFEMVGQDGSAHGWRDLGRGELYALMLAVAKAWADGAPYVLLLEYETDLAAFDAVTLAAVLEDVASATRRGEIVLAALSSPVGLPLDNGWTVIRTDVDRSARPSDVATRPSDVAAQPNAPTHAPGAQAPTHAPSGLGKSRVPDVWLRPTPMTFQAPPADPIGTTSRLFSPPARPLTLPPLPEGGPSTRLHVDPPPPERGTVSPTEAARVSLATMLRPMPTVPATRDVLDRVAGLSPEAPPGMTAGAAFDDVEPSDDPVPSDDAVHAPKQRRRSPRTRK